MHKKNAHKYELLKLNLQA